jgi:hypothetical protein
MELAGRLAREEALASHPDKKRVGCFFISPCSGKITEAKAPIGDETSSIDGVFSMTDIHLPILVALGKAGKESKESKTSGGAHGDLARDLAREIAWGRAGGEAEATVADRKIAWLAVDGMDQCAKILEAVEDGKLDDVELLELMACTGGCVGGPLSIENPSLARHSLKLRETSLNGSPGENPLPEKPTTAEKNERTGPIDCLRANAFPARPALLLDEDYQKAISMMEEMEAISKELPGLDCGCCGAPNCHALAEDIVRGNASRSDCVIILKEQYRSLLEKRGTEET